jgi:hypothetical protein
VAAAGKQRAGKNSRVTIAATNLKLASWKATWRGDDIDTTNFESSGADQGTIGIIGTDWTVSGLWDAGVNFYDSPPGLYPRDDLGALKFYTNVTDNVYHSLATNRVISAENGAEVKQAVNFSASGKAQGCVMSGSIPMGSV